MLTMVRTTTTVTTMTTTATTSIADDDDNADDDGDHVDGDGDDDGGGVHGNITAITQQRFRLGGRRTVLAKHWHGKEVLRIW